MLKHTPADAPTPMLTHVPVHAPTPAQAANDVLLVGRCGNLVVPDVRSSSAAHTFGFAVRLFPTPTPGAPMNWANVPDYDLAANPALKSWANIPDYDLSANLN